MARRTQEIRQVIVPSIGAPRKFSKRIRDKLRKQLILSAVHILTRKRAKNDFKKLVVRRRLRTLKGWGIRDRFDRTYSWAETRLRGPIVYAFWRRGKCLYVGKGKSHKRLRHYKSHIYLYKATQLEVWQIKNKKSLPSAECLAQHLFIPHYNDYKAATKKWTSKCPICRRRHELRAQLNSLLSLKS
jgi:hypothetical protein